MQPLDHYNIPKHPDLPRTHIRSPINSTLSLIGRSTRKHFSKNDILTAYLRETMNNLGPHWRALQLQVPVLCLNRVAATSRPSKNHNK